MRKEESGDPISLFDLRCVTLSHGHSVCHCAAVLLRRCRRRRRVPNPDRICGGDGAQNGPLPAGDGGGREGGRHA